MKRVLFLSTGLGTGGAEKQLARMLSRLREKIAPSVVSLAGRGAVSEEIETLGIPVTHLGLENPMRLPFAAARLFRLARAFSPDVICGWMYHGNLAAYWVRRLALPKARLLWGIHHSPVAALDSEKPLTRRVIRACAGISAQADAIIYCAQSARAAHEVLGYAANRGMTIANGTNTDVFRPNADARPTVRQELGIPADAPLIGLIARFHPVKGHEIFLGAAERLARERADAHFLLAGKDVAAENPFFSQRVKNAALEGRVHLLGERADIPRLTAALDVAASSSWSEAMSNVICEAMSCEVPVAATDVGDARRVLGDAGFLVPAGDAAAMFAAWERLLALSAGARRIMGAAGRRRVAEEFSLEVMAERYFSIFF